MTVTFKAVIVVAVVVDVLSQGYFLMMGVDWRETF
jgi:hypothetical protein